MSTIERDLAIENLIYALHAGQIDLDTACARYHDIVTSGSTDGS